jgi:hypothetical protein
MRPSDATSRHNLKREKGLKREVRSTRGHLALVLQTRAFVNQTKFAPRTLNATLNFFPRRVRDPPRMSMDSTVQPGPATIPPTRLTNTLQKTMVTDNDKTYSKGVCKFFGLLKLFKLKIKIFLF